MSKVTFQEEGHKYTDENGQQYISVTTLLGLYKQPFDADFWSKYKAIEKLVIIKYGESHWISCKKKYGYDKMVTMFEKEFKDSLPKVQEDKLSDWEKEKNEACAKGTEFHKVKEDEINGQKEHLLHNGTVLPLGVNRDLSNLEDGVYTEFLVWNEEYGVAGTADKVTIERPYVDIDDHKTNKAIKRTSFKNEVMKFPLHKIYDCNFCHYEMQISLYAYMFEKHGLIVRNTQFTHYKKEIVQTVEGEVEKITAIPYPTEYRKTEVVKLLEHYARSKR